MDQISFVNTNMKMSSGENGFELPQTSMYRPPQPGPGQCWGPPPPFLSPRPLGPPPRVLYHSDFGQYRFGAPFLRPPGLFSAPPPPLLNPNNLADVNLEGASLQDVDSAWLSGWIGSRLFTRVQEKPLHNGPNISGAHEELKLGVFELKRLREKLDMMQKNVSNLTQEEWNTCWSEIKLNMSNIQGVLEIFAKPDSLITLTTKLQNRVKKRTRQRKLKAQKNIKACQAQLRRQTLHQQADAWLADMQMTVERARRDENLKQEADQVLSEVTHRQSEGRRQIALLEALQKLRKARIQAAEAQGCSLSSELKKQAEQSNTIIERLLGLWTKQMNEYSKEEHGLRVMLEESAAKQVDLEIQNVRRTLGQWEAFLFGSESNHESGEPEDINTLMSIRHAWDQFLVPNKAVLPMASTIPVGWVLPTTPSSSVWQKLLFQS